MIALRCDEGQPELGSGEEDEEDDVQNGRRDACLGVCFDVTVVDGPGIILSLNGFSLIQLS